jgi:hypothetical protein
MAHLPSQGSHAVGMSSSGKPGDGLKPVRAADQYPRPRWHVARYRRCNPGAYLAWVLFNTRVLLEIVEVELAQLDRVVSPDPNPVLHH